MMDEHLVNYWTGAANTTSWDNAGNWSGNAGPLFYNPVTIGIAGKALTVAVASLTTPRAGSLTIGDGGGNETVLLNLAGSFDLNGSTLAVSANTALTTVGGAIDLEGGSLLINAGGSYAELGGSLAATALSNNGVLKVTGAINLAGEVVSGVGSIDVDGGSLGTASTLISIVGAQAFTIENGGSLALRTTLGATGITFGSGANTLYVQNDIGIVGTPILNFGAGDKIVVQGQQNITSVSEYKLPNGAYAVTLDVGAYYSPITFTDVTFAAGVDPTRLAVAISGTGQETVYVACFLSGTRIETETGGIEVEALSVGDQVVTADGGKRRLRPVTWIGRRAIDLSGLDPEVAREAAPIRIRAHAFADLVPARDLLITPEHCILIDGGLVPARMLVNGASIVRDLSLQHYTVHHIECDRHSIVLSEGLTTESYLDTGNRGSFGSADDDSTRRSQDWADAAAPLTTSRAFVEPIWRRLSARAAALGLSCDALDVELTTDARLRVRLQDGSLLHAIGHDGERHFFLLPAGSSSATILSRSFVPAQVDGPFVDDRRRLGVAVSDARLWTGPLTETLAIDANHLGWHAAEHPARWTDGAGSLAIGPLAQATMLELTLRTAGAYPLEQPNALLRAA